MLKAAEIKYNTLSACHGFPDQDPSRGLRTDCTSDNLLSAASVVQGLKNPTVLMRAIVIFSSAELTPVALEA
jgi:hypothetical protein